MNNSSEESKVNSTSKEKNEITKINNKDSLNLHFEEVIMKGKRKRKSSENWLLEQQKLDISYSNNKKNRSTSSYNISY